MNRPSDGAPTLKGTHAELRPIAPSDFDYLYSLELRPSATARWRFRGATPNPEGYARTLFDNVSATFVVCAAESKSRAGLVSCYAADLRNRVAYVAALADDTQAASSLLVVEGVAILVDYCFAMWEFRKLYFESPEFALVAFASANGNILHEEGRLKGHDYFDGAHYDRVTLALYGDEWSKSRLRLLNSEPNSGVPELGGIDDFLVMMGEVVGVDLRSSAPTLRLRQDLHLDSLQLLEMIVACEQLAGAEIPERLMAQILTLDDAYQWVTARR